VKRSMLTYLEKSTKSASRGSVTAVGSDVSGHTLSHSSVSTFGVRYNPPLPASDLSPAHGVEALVEGSKMSMLREGAFYSLKKLFV